MSVAKDIFIILLSIFKLFQRETFSYSVHCVFHLSKKSSNCNLQVIVSGFKNSFLLTTFNFLDARYMYMQDRIIYFLEVCPCFPLFSMCAYILLKLHPNDSKLQNYEIFCNIFFLEVENWETLIADAALWIQFTEISLL